MPIDPNIILSGQAPKLDNPMDSYVKALTLKQLANQTQMQDRQMAEDQAMKEAFRNNMQTGPNGAATLNRAGVLSDLTKVNPMKAIDYKKMFDSQDLEELKKHTEVAKNLSWSVNDDGSNYNEVRQKAVQMGLPNAEQMPEVYSPGFVNNWKMHTLTGEEQLNNHMKQQEFERKDRENQLKHEENQIKRSQLNFDKDNKAAESLDKHLGQGWAGKSGQAGQVQGKINAAEYAEGLIEQGKTQQGGLDSRQIEELAQSTARLLGGSAAASARVEALVPHTLMGRAQTLKEWLTNNPQGAEAQAFVDRLAETVQREKAIASDQMRKFQVEGLPAHAGLKSRNPQLYNSILNAKGVTPDMIDEKGQYIPEAKRAAKKTSSDQDSAPVKTFKTHEIEWAD